MKIVIELDTTEASKLLSLIAGAIPAEAIGAAIAAKIPSVLDSLPTDVPVDDMGMVRFRVINVGSNLISAIKRSREIVGMGLKESKDFVERTTPYIKIPKASAIELKIALEDVGCSIEIF